MTTIADVVTKKIINRLFHGEDYRVEIVNLINAEFLDYVIEFFKKIVTAKLKHKTINIDWYKEEFLNERLSSEELIINSGLNHKTITNMYNSATREIVLEVTNANYERLYEAINLLVEHDNEIDLTLTIKFNGVSVDLNINESLIVINVLAVKRAQLRGGLWSSAGKQVQYPLMLTLCKLFNVPTKNYSSSGLSEQGRDVDFFLIDNDKKEFHCEVKLMGRGNPESADVVIARDTGVFVADKLSDLNKNQLSNLKIEWVEMRSPEGYKRFETVLKNLNIPYSPIIGNFEERFNQVLSEIFEI